MRQESPLPASLVSEEGADEGEDDVSYTWQGPGSIKGSSFQRGYRERKHLVTTFSTFYYSSVWGWRCRARATAGFNK